MDKGHARCQETIEEAVLNNGHYSATTTIQTETQNKCKQQLTGGHEKIQSE